MLVTSSNTSTQDKRLFLTAANWTASTSYAVGDRVRPTTRNGRVYHCTGVGT
jgi:hypothetical protein